MIEMKYYTTKWFNLTILNYLEGIKIIEDKKYSEEEIKHICEKEYAKQLKQFIKVRGKFYKSPENYFEEIYRDSLKNSKEYFPDFVVQNVDIRFLALHLMPKSIYNKLMKYENKNRQEYVKVNRLAEKELNNQDIPEDILELFCGLHDSIILKIVKDNTNIILSIKTEEGIVIKLKFENGQFLENEVEDYFKKEKNNDMYCDWAYHELYKIDNKYELHILVCAYERPKYITIRCENIKEDMKTMN